jgi:cholest-4-en-3-one 26-monooxygenase
MSAVPEGFDPYDTELFADGPPHELFATLRKDEPVRWIPTSDNGGFWSLTRHADIAAVSRDTETFSSYEAGIFLHPDQVAPLDLTRNLLLYKDPPDHTKYRKILQTAFVPNTVAALEGDVRARVTKEIDKFIEAGTCDFTRDLAVRVPLCVLIELFGVDPDEHFDTFYRWTHEIEMAQLSPEPAAALPTFGEMAAFLMEEIQRQAQADEETLVTKLRAAEVEGQRLTDEEILVFFALLAFAGNDTTRNTASNGMLALLQHPDQWRLLVDDPELIPQAVEEILRWTSVVNYFFRTATADTEIGGQRIAKGDKVMIWYTSGSRDPDACEDPGRFDVTRQEMRHMAFGGGGRHFCLGAGLARLELRVMFEEVARRMPDIRQTGPEERLSSTWANSLTSLPVEFTPGARESTA